MTRERLLAAVWGYEYEGESRTVDIHVQQVRRKMGLKGKLITIPKLGYRLESEEKDETLAENFFVFFCADDCGH